MFEQYFTEGMPSLLENIKIKPTMNQNRSDEMNIISKPTATYEQCEKWLRSKTDCQLAIQNLPTLYNAALSNGINPVVLIAQAMVETGFFKFGGVIDSSFHNTCGLKTTKGGGNYVANAHMRFATWEEGIQAHADHLGLYAGSTNCPKYSPECASHQNKDYKCNGTTKDPRHFTYLYGKYKTVESLKGSWATDPQYDKKLFKFIREIEGTQVDVSTGSVELSKVPKKPIQRPSVIEDIEKGIKKGLFKPFKKR